MKKSLSIVLSVLMIMTAWVFVAPEKAEAAVQSSGDLPTFTFYVPETIYLDPADNKTFKYYVDRAQSVNGSLTASNSDTSAWYYFKCDTATSVDSLTCGASSPSLSKTSSTNGELKGIISGGALSSAISMNATALVPWTVTFTTAKGTFTATAYSTAYAPNRNVTANGVAGYSGNNYIKSYASSLIYIQGAQTTAAATMVALDGFQSSDVYNYQKIKTDELMLDPLVNGVAVPDDNNPKGYSQSSSPFTNATNSFGGCACVSDKNYGNNSDWTGHIACNKTPAEVIVDTSRYSNTSQLPNLKLGYIVTDYENSTARRHSYVSDCTSKVSNPNNLSSATFVVDSTDILKHSYWRSDSKMKKIYGSDQNTYGTVLWESSGASSPQLGGDSPGSNIDGSTDDVGKKYLAPISYSVSGSGATTIRYFRGCASGNKSSSYSMSCSMVLLKVTTVTKADLRTLINSCVGTYINPYYTGTRWNNYNTALQNAYTVLGNPKATQSQINTAKTNLQDAANNLKFAIPLTLDQDSSANLAAGGELWFSFTPSTTKNYVFFTHAGYDTQYELYEDTATSSSRDQDDGDYDIRQMLGLGLQVYDEMQLNAGTTYYFKIDAYSASSSGDTPVRVATPVTVTFNATGGTNKVYDLPKGYDTLKLDKTAVSRTGHTLVGWSNSNTSSEELYKLKSETITVPTSAKTYYALWSPNNAPTLSVNTDYTATIDAAGEIEFYQFTPTEDGKYLIYGTGSTDSYVLRYDPSAYPTTGQPLDTQDDSSNSTTGNTTGYDFGIQGTQFFMLKELEANTTYWYGVKYWSTGTGSAPFRFEKVYKVDYDLNGADDTAPADQDKFFGKDLTLSSAEPTRDYYTFKGWSTDEDATAKEYDPSGTYSENDDATLYAVWDPDDYSIGYSLDGGTVTTANPTTYNVETETFTLNNPTKKGYTFTGWTGSNGSTPQTSVTIEKGSHGDLSYTANWTKDSYTISYTLNGGTATGNPISYEVDTATFTLNNPARDYFTFKGWSGTDLTGDTNTEVTVETGSTGNREYTANWTPIDYTITYELGGGTLAEGVTNPETYNYDTPTFTLNNPTRANYEFAGWTDSNGETAQTSVTIEQGSHDDKSYTATWTPVGYTISYDLAEGRMPDGANNPEGYNVESAPITLINPIRDGYEFAGWTGTDLTEATETVSIPTGSSGDRAYTATWNIVTYTISYDLDEGTVNGTNPVEYTIEDGAITLINPTKIGYRFEGWTGSNGDTPVVDLTIPAGSTGDRNYIANWTTENYIIAYKGLEGATMTGAKNSYTYIDPAYTIPTPEKSGYTFTGWSGTDLEGENNLEVVIPTNSLGDREYTAHWEIINYNIGYTLNGGTVEGRNPTTYNVDTDTFTLKNPTKTGYTFKGWSGTGLEGDENTSVTITKGSTEDRSYTANWTPITYNIGYTLNGGTVEGTNPPTYTIESGAITLINPTKTGYRFVGWTGTDLTEATETATIPAGSIGDRSYTANWEIVNYTIDYDVADGSHTNPTEYNVLSEPIILADASRTGYTFLGWTGSNGDTPEKNVLIPTGSTGDLSYTANWEAITYTIGYTLNGGTVEGENPVRYTIATDAITLINPTKTGYTFKGWTGTDLTDKTMEVTIPAGSIGDRSYTANWEATEYTITIDAKGGTVEGTNPDKYTIESDAITLINPTKTGYTFTGWTGTDLTEATETVTIPAGSIGDRSFTANWEAIEYTIGYTLNGGTVEGENPGKYTIESDAITLINPTKTGYTFKGWTGTDLTDKTMEVTIPAGSIGDRSYTANWEATEYTITIDAKGGTVEGTNPDKYTIESDAITLINPTKTGYTFTGWTGTDLTEATETVTIPAGSIGDRSYTATWTPTIYNLSYELNGADAAPANPATYTIEGPDVTLINPEKTAYDFAGWTGTDLTGATETVTIPTGSIGDRSFEATWTPTTYNISYELDGGTVEGTNPPTYDVETATFTLINPTKTGYTFTGWTGSNGTQPQIDVTVERGTYGVLNYTANWSLDEYTITYNTEGGEASNPASYSVETESFTLNNPTKTAYDFTGWTGTDLTDKTMEVTIAKGSTGNRAYTATWTPTFYDISYELDGGTVDGTNPDKYTIESDTFTLINPTKTGYTFLGWTGSNIDEPQLDVTVENGTYGDLSYTANWEINGSTLVIDPNGGTWEGSEEAQTFVNEYDATMSIPDPESPNIDLHFTGWTLSEGANGSFEDGVYTYGAEKDRIDTLTANFEPHTYGEPTYTWDGVESCTAVGTCTFCGHENTEVSTNITDEVTTPATCTENGTTTYTATFSDPGFTAQTKDLDNIPPLGHNPIGIRYENIVEATCTERGSYDRVTCCTRCGLEFSRETMETYPAGHTVVVVPGTPATCSEPGTAGTSICSVCGAVLSQSEEATVIPATGKHVDNDKDGFCDTCGTQVGEEAQPGACPWCHKIHTGFWGKIVSFFHIILAFFIRNGY